MSKAYVNQGYSLHNEGGTFIMKILDFIDALMQYGFLQKALLTSVMVGIIWGVIGCFIILRGMALMGDAISHAVLPGGSAFLYDWDELFYRGSFNRGYHCSWNWICESE